MKYFELLIPILLINLSLCAIDGCQTASSDGTTCTTCNTGYLLSADKSTCLYQCKTEGTSDAANTCATCNTNYLLSTDKSTCLYQCKTEGTGNSANTCATCNDGYTLSSGTCTDPEEDEEISFSLKNSLLISLLTFLF